MHTGIKFPAQRQQNGLPNLRKEHILIAVVKSLTNPVSGPITPLNLYSLQLNFKIFV